MPTREEDEDRRAFLKTCGRFAAVTPPAMSLLLSTSLTSTAIARSGAQDGAGYSGGGSRHSVFDNDPDSATKEHSTKEHSSSGGSGGDSGGGAGENAGGAKGSKIAHSGEEGSRSGGGGGNKASSDIGGQDGDDKKRMSAIEKDKSSAA